MQGKERSSELSFPLGILIREIVGSPSFNVQYVKIIPLYLNKKNFFFLSSISFTKILYRRTFSNFLLSFINRRKLKKNCMFYEFLIKKKRGGWETWIAMKNFMNILTLISSYNCVTSLLFLKGNWRDEKERIKWV